MLNEKLLWMVNDYNNSNRHDYQKLKGKLEKIDRLEKEVKDLKMLFHNKNENMLARLIVEFEAMGKKLEYVEHPRGEGKDNVEVWCFVDKGETYVFYYLEDDSIHLVCNTAETFKADFAKGKVRSVK